MYLAAIAKEQDAAPRNRISRGLEREMNIYRPVKRAHLVLRGRNADHSKRATQEDYYRVFRALYERRRNPTLAPHLQIKSLKPDAGWTAKNTADVQAKQTQGLPVKEAKAASAPGVSGAKKSSSASKGFAGAAKSSVVRIGQFLVPTFSKGGGDFDDEGVDFGLPFATTAPHWCSSCIEPPKLKYG